MAYEQGLTALYQNEEGFMQEWYLLLYILHLPWSFQVSLSVVWDLKPLFQCSSQCVEFTSIISMKRLQLCFRRKWLQLHFTGKSVFLCFKYFSCENTYRSSSYIVRKTPVLNMQILKNIEAEHESNWQS